jgi:hypothetical protein
MIFEGVGGTVVTLPVQVVTVGCARATEEEEEDEEVLMAEGEVNKLLTFGLRGVRATKMISWRKRKRRRRRNTRTCQQPVCFAGSCSP